MMLFEKLFRLEPTEKDQWRFLEGLGALNEDFFFVERTSEEVLRVCRVQDGKRELILDVDEKSPLPVLTFCHGKGISNEKAIGSFGEKILPYPWSELFLANSGEGSIHFSDNSFKERCDLFRQAISHLEMNCLRAEVTCLKWGSSNEDPVYVFHSVRDKIIRVGLCELNTLKSMKSDLQKVRSAILTLPEDKPTNFKGFELALHRIKTLTWLEERSESSESRPYQDEPIPFEL